MPSNSKIPEWAKNDPLMTWYATEIWGKRVDNDDMLFEIMSLQVFQAGLTWKMILKRRDAFRKAFHNWNINVVASMNSTDVQKLLQNSLIIRNRKKIEACISNANVIKFIQKEHGSFCNWFYNILEGNDLLYLQQTLKKTFKFLGSEIARMWLMACGRIPDKYS